MTTENEIRGWVVEVMTPPGLKRQFYVAAPDAEKAVALVQGKIRVHPSDSGQATIGLSGDDLLTLGVKDGEVKQRLAERLSKIVGNRDPGAEAFRSNGE